MSDVFVSHAEVDSGPALRLADALERAGYSTWTFERDSTPEAPLLLQSGPAVERCQALLLLISRDSLASRQMTAEVVRAHETGKPFVPVLIGMTHVEFAARQPEWREAMGGATSVAVPAEGVDSVVPPIIAGLRALGVEPSGAQGEHLRVAEAPAPASRRTAPLRGLVALPTWQRIALVVGVLVMGALVLVVGGAAVAFLVRDGAGQTPSGPTTAASPPGPDQSETSEAEPVDGATTPLKTNMGAARIRSAQIAEEFCPPGGFPGACETPSANQFLVLTLEGEGSVTLTIWVTQDSNNSHVLIDGQRYNPATFADESGGVVRIVYAGVPASAVGRKAILIWPGNPPFEVRLTR